MPRTENAQFYQLYFQEPGAAEAELGRERQPGGACPDNYDIAVHVFLP